MSLEEMPIMACSSSSGACLLRHRAGVGSWNEDLDPAVLGASFGSLVVGDRRGLDVAVPYGDLICSLLGRGVVGGDIGPEGGADALQLRDLIGFGRWRRWRWRGWGANDRELADVVERRHLGCRRVDAAGEPIEQNEIDAKQHEADATQHAPPRHAQPRRLACEALSLPARRQLAVDLRTQSAQRFVKIALDLLQCGDAARGGAMDAVESQRQAGVLQLEEVVIDDRVLLEARELVKEAHAADAFAEKTAQHAVLRPDVTVLSRDVLDDVVGGGANDVFGGICLGLGNAGGADVLLEKFYGVGDLLHQARERRAGKRDAQAAENKQERAGGAQDRIFVRGDELVDPHLRDAHLEDRLRRLSRRRDPFFSIGISRSSRRYIGCSRRRRRLRRPGGLRHRIVGWGLRRGRAPPSRIGANDGLLPRNAERTARWKLVVHRRSSNTAHNSSSSSGQSPEKCMPMELAVENSGHSGDLRSKKK